MTSPRGRRRVRRIAMVAACPFPANHGTPGAIRELCVALAHKGHEVHVVTYPIGDAMDVRGVQVHRVPNVVRHAEVKIGPSWPRLVFDALLVPKLISVVRKYDIEVIHAHNYEATIAGAVAKWMTGRALVYNGINSMADELPTYGFRPAVLARTLGRWLDHVVPRTADATIVLSDELKDYLTSLGMSRQGIVVIPPGVTVDDMASGDAMSARAKHGLSTATPIVMYTGAMEAFQRLELLVRAMPNVLLQHPRAVFMVVNNIPNRAAQDRLTALADSAGVGDRLIIAESVGFAELPNYLAAADVAVVPRPTCPGFPIKLLNYMAAGKAIVSFEGSAKALCHGYNGYVAKGENVEDLAQGIGLLLGDRALRQTLGDRARESLKGVYDWDTLASGILQIYEQLEHPSFRSSRAFNYAELGEHLKAEYRPRLATNGHSTPGFLQPGPIEYPRFSESRP